MNAMDRELLELSATEMIEVEGGLPGTGCPACDGPQFPIPLGPSPDPLWPIVF
jgi:hypothetical protein